MNANRLQHIGASFSSTYRSVLSTFDNLKSHPESDVTFLPNNHEDENDFLFQVRLLDAHFNPARDILIIEAPEGSPYFEKKKQKFQAACRKINRIVGWAPLEAYEKALHIKAIFKAASALKDENDDGCDASVKAKAVSILSGYFPEAANEEELIERSIRWLESPETRIKLLSCLIEYQAALIAKIIDLQKAHFRVFVDVGSLHVNPLIAVEGGFADFLPQIDLLQMSLIGKRVRYFYPSKQD